MFKTSFKRIILGLLSPIVMMLLIGPFKDWKLTNGELLKRGNVISKEFIL